MLVNAVVSRDTINKDYIMLQKVLTQKNIVDMVKKCLKDEGLIFHNVVSDPSGLMDSAGESTVVLQVTLRETPPTSYNNFLHRNLTDVSDFTNMGPKL